MYAQQISILKEEQLPQERCASSTSTVIPWNTLRPPGKKFVCSKKRAAQQDAIDDAPWGDNFDTCNVEPAIGVESEPFFLVVSKDNFFQVQRLNSHYGNNISARC